MALRLESGFDEGRGGGGIVMLGLGLVVINGSVSVSIKVSEVLVAVEALKDIGIVAVINCIPRSVSIVKDTL
jgi:hypothetical protein